MALKKKPTQQVQVGSVETKAVVTVSTDTADQLLRNKGEYELVKTAPEQSGSDATSKAPKKAKKGKGAASEGAAGGTATAPVKPEWPRGSFEEWSSYAKDLGIDVAGLDRNGIHAAVVDHESKSS